MKLLKQVTLDRANRKKDKSVSLTFITDLEQNSQEFMEIDELLNSSGIVYFKAGDISAEEIKAIDNYKLEEKQTTSKSKRLRNIIYRVWQKSVMDGETELNSEDFYNDKMESLIDYYKNILRDEV